MTNDSIPFLLYAAGVMLMALLLFIVWHDRDTGETQPADQRRSIYPRRVAKARKNRLRRNRYRRSSAAAHGARGSSSRGPRGAYTSRFRQIDRMLRYMQNGSRRPGLPGNGRSGPAALYGFCVSYSSDIPLPGTKDTWRQTAKDQRRQRPRKPGYNKENRPRG